MIGCREIGRDHVSTRSCGNAGRTLFAPALQLDRRMARDQVRRYAEDVGSLRRTVERARREAPKTMGYRDEKVL